MTEQPQPQGKAQRTTSRVPHLVVALSLALGLVLRLRALPSGGLFQDDAWVALTGTTSWSQAFKMAGTAPGFVAVLHVWLPLSSSPIMAVLPALGVGILGLVSVVLVLRRLRAESWVVALGVATIALSPVAVATSGHVKQYTLDFLLALWMTYLAQRSREHLPHALQLFVLLSLGGIIFSASTVIVFLGAWLVIGAEALRGVDRRRQALLAGSIAGFGFIVIFAVAYRNLPVALTRYWADYLLQPSPLSTWPSRAGNVIRGITTGLLPTSTSLSHEVMFVTALLGCLVLLGALSREALPGRAIALATIVVAVILALFSKVPLGTGRTDMALYPALLLLGLSGVRELVRKVATFAPTTRAVAALVCVLVVATFVTTSVANERHYLDTPIRAALLQASTCATDDKPLLVIDPYTRYPYALTTPSTVTELFSREYGAGFTVSVPQDQATILPAQSYERPYQPKRWANGVIAHAQQHRTAASFVAYVQTPPSGAKAALAQQLASASTPNALTDPFLAQLLRRDLVMTRHEIVGPLLVTCLRVPSTSPH